MGDYYVYVFLDGRKSGKYCFPDYCFLYEPIYVGKGKGNRIKESLKKGSLIKMSKINKIINSGFEVLSLKIIENVSNEESLMLESKIIKDIGRYDLKKGSLCNTTDGGDGGRVNSSNSYESIQKQRTTMLAKNFRWNHTDETINKMSKAQKGIKNGFYNKVRTEKWKLEHSNKISGVKHPMYNKKHDEKTLIKIKENSNRGKDYLYWEKHKENSLKQMKIVFQYDLENNFINEFSSVKEASIKTGFTESRISKCCRGLTKNPKPYIWKYKEGNILSNSFEYKIGDIYNDLTLIKRMKKTCILEDSEKNIIQIHKKYNEELWSKKTLD